MHFILSSAATTTSPFLNAWLVGTLFALLVLLGFTSGFLRAWQSQHWPSVPGRVVESRALPVSSLTEDSHRGPNVTYQPLVRYSYMVAGVAQESKQISIGALTDSEPQVLRIVARYPVGAEVTVYHHASRHFLAVLEPGKYLLPLLATLVALAAFAFAVAQWVSYSLHPASP